MYDLFVNFFVNIYVKMVLCRRTELTSNISPKHLVNVKKVYTFCTEYDVDCH